MSSIYDTVSAGTVTDVFGIPSIHETITEQARWTDAAIDTDQAEADYRATLEAYLPEGWEIVDDDVRHWLDAEPANLTDVRLAIIPAVRYFDLADYAY